LLHCGTETDYWVPIMEDGGLQKPLEFHEDYRMKWNYHLAMANGTTTHSGYDAATTPKLSAADGKIKKWVKESSEYLVDWAILDGFEKKKPGVESFILPSPVVREFKRFVTAGSAFNEVLARSVGFVYNNTNVITISDMYWMVMTNNLSFDGMFWLATVTYQGSDYWDVDLYGEPRNQP
jgi:hypothetical protein